MVDDDVVAALAKLTEAVELVEVARERLCDFRALVACADALVQEASRRLGGVGDGDPPPGAFSLLRAVDEFDACYYRRLKAVEHQWRVRLLEHDAAAGAAAAGKRR